jgi:hypothetical protein
MKNLMLPNIYTWFQKKSIRKIGFEDVKYAIAHPNQYILINTLPVSEQKCLIKTTLEWNLEEKLINEMMNQYTMNSRTFIIYGKNAVDDSVDKKYHQMNDLGFTELYIYSGGIFEWILLQDIYGDAEFPTTSRELDVLKFRPIKSFDVPRLSYR